MFKKISILLVIASLALTTACKKGETSPVQQEDGSYRKESKLPVSNLGTDEIQKIQPPADGKYPELTFDEKEYDFGLINQGDKVQHDFKFKNTGEGDLIIVKAKGSCGCTIPEYPKEYIKPGGSGVISVSFNSTGKVGKHTKSVTITCNTKKQIEILHIKASIKVPEGTTTKK